MRDRFFKLALLGVALGSMAGCRFKSWESFTTATTPNPPTPPTAGDPYSYGSPAEASGGLKVQTDYNSGASNTPQGKIDPLYGRPAMGSGQMPGEAGVEAAPGYGETNAPSFQPGPSESNSSANR